MGFDRRDNARRYVPQEGDTLERIAERERAAGNPVTWQEIARFNWGTDDPHEVDACLRDELGCRKRDAANHYVISTEDEPRSELLIPVAFKKAGLALGKTYTLRVRRKQCPEQFLGCCSLPGVTFALNKSFLRPSVIERLRPLETLARAHPEAKIMIFGHTDAVGGELHNKRLSERRAWSVHAFITNDVAAWETLYNRSDESWGVPALQEILEALGHDPGVFDGVWGPRTRAAVRAFLGLPEGAAVQNDAAFRARLFAAYMAGKHEIDLPPARFMELGYMGCGEFNPIEDSPGAREANRRVTFYLFHPARLPNLPCAFNDVAPCKKQMVSLEARHKASFRCSFYDSWAKSCPGEGPITATLRILYHVPPELEPYWEPPREWFELVSSGGSYASRREGTAAARIDDEHFALDFDGVVPGRSYTMTRHFHEDSRFRVFTDLPFEEIEPTCSAGACQLEAVDEPDADSASGRLTTEEIEMFGEYDIDRFLLDSLDRGVGEDIDPRDYV
jgi:outer membrane protein OmpA-like peptidoglycan-associated protein